MDVPVVSSMELMDSIADEGDGHPKCQHHSNNDANTQPQPELDISQYQAGSCHAIAGDHAIAFLDLIFRHVSCDDGDNSSQ